MSPSSVMNPKTIIPKPIPYEVVRQKMLEQISVFKADCMVLIAPSGYGKTTLLAQYARNTKRKVVWLTLRGSDIEQDNLIISIQQAFHTHTGIKVNTAEQQSLEDFLYHLISEIASYEKELDLIIDHVEIISNLHGEFLSRLVHTMPRGHRVILAGYDISGFSLARMVASGQVQVINQDQLCLSLEEIQYLLHIYKSDLNPKNVLKATEGWPVGVVLNALGCSKQIDIYELLQDVVSKLPDDVIKVITELSVIEIWSEAAAIQLKIDFPQNLLKTLKRVGLPLTPLGHGVFKPHSLLLKMLRDRLNQYPERAAVLYTAYAEETAKEGKLSWAMQYAAKANRVDLLEEYALKLFSRLKNQYEFKLLLQLVALYTEGEPVWWKEYRAIALIETGDVYKGQDILENLLENGHLTALGYTALATRAVRLGKFDEQLDFALKGLELEISENHLTLNLHKATALISLGRPVEGLEVTQKIIGDANAKGDVLTEADALNIHQYGLQMLRRWPERLDALNRSSQLYHFKGYAYRAVKVDIKRVEDQIVQGDLKEMDKLTSLPLEFFEDNHPAVLISFYHCQTGYFIFLGKIDEALDSLEKAREIIASRNIKTLLPRTEFYFYDIFNMIGDSDRAQEAYEEALNNTVSALQKEKLAPLFKGLDSFDRRDFKKAETFFEKTIDSSIDQLHYIRAQVMLLAVQHHTGHVSVKLIHETEKQLKDLNIKAVCQLDSNRLKSLVAYLKNNYPSHPLVKLDSSSILCKEEREETDLVIEINDSIECYYNNQELKLPLARSGELLVWLIWHKDGSLHEILDDLWGSSRESKHHEYFRVLVRRLRARLKSLFPEKSYNPILYSKRKYSLNSQLSIGCNLLEAIDKSKQGDHLSLLQIKTESILSSIEGAWIDKIRLAIHNEQLSALKKIEDQSIEMTQESKIQLLKDAIRVNPEKEELNLTLIRVLISSKAGDAMIAFQVYKNMLKVNFDCEPDPLIIDELRSLGLAV